jgi:hypothetical protein
MEAWDEEAAVRAIRDEKANEFRRFVESAGRLEAPLLGLAERANNWLAMPEAFRREMLEICNLFEDGDEDGSVWFNRTSSQVLTEIEIGLAKPIIRSYFAAVNHLKASVRAALTEEQRAIKEGLLAMDKPSVQASIREGEADVAAGRISSFTKDEFIKRFVST